ncbi:hypothetical protein [Bacillus manliponensis]|uniref:hypothetical protein n=1 Tax=Bacillus manliponensis TaxID=574376 RepID=UPI00068F5206|nr:hypothetical protein [Bacillus manliponensis]
MIPFLCIVATIASLIFAIVYRMKHPAYSLFVVALIPGISGYVLAEFQYTQVFIGMLIVYCICVNTFILRQTTKTT